MAESEPEPKPLKLCIGFNPHHAGEWLKDDKTLFDFNEDSLCFNPHHAGEWLKGMLLKC